MSAGLYNLYIEQGARLYRTFAIEDDGVPRDLTGYGARMQLRRAHGASAILAEWDTSSPSHLTIDEPAGIITLDVTAEETADLPRASGYYDLELIPPTGEDDVERLLQGTALISPEVTREVSP